ncbi:MAG: hypothetical protein LZ161_00855 [Thaumarchaeota archaeon]|nr:hypothetical protein [Candidatus Terraquivivens yellowstonensis]
MKMNGFRDLMKIGILLIGISAIIIASLATHVYLTQSLRQQPPLTAYCYDMAIVITAGKELRDVRILDNRSSILHTFPRIPAGSQEFFIVPSEGVYAVQANDYKVVVHCMKSQVMQSRTYD